VLIEEPAPPEAPQVSPQPTPAPKPPRRRRVLRTEPPPSNVEVTPQPTEPPPTPEVPALEPRESSAQETALRQQIQELRENVGRQISRLDKTQLSSADRKILEDARTFFAQSGRALEEGDLQRALTLARKASLLISALE
jgi:outer membrane biosynthesis protein TonB